MNETRGLWRGKRVDNGEWIEGDMSRIKVANHYFVDEFMVDPSTLGECTGLTDKNGKLIFEGDILEYPEYLERDVVEWDDEFAGFLLVDIDPAYTGVANLCEAIDGVIIGNIHDNPELLKGEHNNEMR